jgi:hypothetical protein
MTSCDPHPSEQEIVESLLADLDEEKLRLEIDSRIDAAIGSFSVAPGPVRSQRAFLDAVADLVRHLYQWGLRVPRSLTPTQARAEAVFLLERDYRRPYDAGFDAALLDATGSDEQGLQLVLSSLVEGIKLSERQMYVRWIFTKHLAGCSWSTERAIAGVILEKLSAVLPPSLVRCDSAQLADLIVGFITLDVSTTYSVQQLLRNVSLSPEC